MLWEWVFFSANDLERSRGDAEPREPAGLFENPGGSLPEYSMNAYAAGDGFFVFLRCDDEGLGKNAEHSAHIGIPLMVTEPELVDERRELPGFDCQGFDAHVHPPV